MNKIQEIVYNAARNKLIKELTKDLGPVVEEDNRLVCYVNDNKIPKVREEYIVGCFGVPDEWMETVKKFKLDKPICYVFDRINFNNHKIRIFGYCNPEVIIENCNFLCDAHIYINGKCTIYNSRIEAISGVNISADELTLSNTKCNNATRGLSPHMRFGSNNRINIVDSTLLGSASELDKRTSKITIYAAKELNVKNSTIDSKELTCESLKVTVDKESKIKAVNKVSINTENFDQLTFATPLVILNGEEFTSPEDNITLKKLTDPLSIKRMELINVLTNIRNKCERINEDKIRKEQERLNQESIISIVK